MKRSIILVWTFFIIALTVAVYYKAKLDEAKKVKKNKAIGELIEASFKLGYQVGTNQGRK